MKLDKRTITIFALLIGGGVALHWLLQNLSLVGGVLATVWGLLFPFVLGFIIAFVLNLPMRALETKLFKNWHSRARRPVSFILAVVLVLAVVALVVFLVIPQLVETLIILAGAMPGYLASAEAALEPYLEYLPQLQTWLEELDIDWHSLLASVTSMLQNGAGNFFSSAFDVASSIVNGFVSFFIGIVFAAYLLLDKEHLTAQLQGLLKAWLPEKRYTRLLEIASLTNRTYSGFVAGQCTEALIITVLYIVSSWVGGFNYPLLIGVLVGFLSLIPIVGTLVGCILSTFLLLISMGFWRALAFVILFIIIQNVEGNLIYPHVVGGSVGLPAVWILVAVTVGGGLAGIFGMLFFIPLFSVIYTLVAGDARARLAKKGIPSPVSELPPKPPKKQRRKREKKQKNRVENTEENAPENMPENEEK